VPLKGKASSNNLETALLFKLIILTLRAGLPNTTRKVRDIQNKEATRRSGEDWVL